MVQLGICHLLEASCSRGLKERPGSVWVGAGWGAEEWEATCNDSMGYSHGVRVGLQYSETWQKQFLSSCLGRSLGGKPAAVEGSPVCHHENVSL